MEARTNVETSPSWLGASGAPFAMPASSGDRTLFDLLEAHARAGLAVPVAVVGALVDDLAARVELGPSFGRQRPTLFDVFVEPDGHARLRSGYGATTQDLARLLREALQAGYGEELVPAAAWPLVAEFEWSADPRSITFFRGLLRRSLGAPAPRAEVVKCLTDAERLDARAGDTHIDPSPPLAVVADPELHDSPTQTVGSDAPLAASEDSDLWVKLSELSSGPRTGEPLAVPEPVDDQSQTQRVSADAPAFVLEHLPSRPPPLFPTPGEPKRPRRAAEVPEHAGSVRHRPVRLSNPVSLGAAPDARLSSSSPGESSLGPIRLPSDGRRLARLALVALVGVLTAAWLLGAF